MDDLVGKPTIFGNIQLYTVGIYWVYPLLKGFLVENPMVVGETHH